jgi:macrodomain Ter protein organizer (MatP/YcbG family)
MAGRPPYQITQKDFSYAWRYIERGMQRADISNAHGYMEFRNAGTPEKLQAWVDDYLPDDVFEKLKQAVRASRKRMRDYNTVQRKINVALDHTAHSYLLSVAEDLGMTLSEAIIEMENIYWKAKDAGL